MATIKIVEAFYGVITEPNSRADVKAKLESMLPSSPTFLNIPVVNNESLGVADPAPGKGKQLKVRYSTGQRGATLSKTINEGGSLAIGAPTATTIAVAPAAPQAPPTSNDRPRVGGTPTAYKASRPHTPQPLAWESKNGQLFANKQRFHLKGVNYFGFETNTRYPHGLWQLTVDQVLDFLTSNNFNAVRLPFSLAMALDLGKVNDQWLQDADLRGLACGVLLSKFIDRCGDKGILVMLDLHRLNESDIPELWWDKEYSECQLLEGWDNILDICKDKWNVFALDLKNEPHGDACWGKGGEEKDWKNAAEKVANHIIKNHPEYKGLYFIEGINRTENMACETPCHHAAWWGGSFQGLQGAPVQLADPAANNRIVWSPHVYGPSVFMQEYFKSPDFPENMPKIWMDQWGFAKAKTGNAVVIGEWGGWYNTLEDQTWQQHLADFLIKNDMADTFYWCLNPDSGDTGGLVEEDWVTPIQPKLDLLAKVQPNPTKLRLEGNGQVSIVGEQSN